MIILISFAAFCSTLLGGLIAIRFKDKLHLILGFSAGAVIGVAFFDLIPESLDLGSKFFAESTVMAIVALGFLIYLVLDRVVFLHAHVHDTETDSNEHKSEHNHESSVIPNDSEHIDAGRQMNDDGQISRGILGAGSLSIHSFLDGVAIGLAFQVSAAIGAVVAVAVLVHDFSDGINTVNLILKGSTKNDSSETMISRNESAGKFALKWLLVDAVAPVLGAASTLFFTVPEQGLSIILALFSGFFLYIGASDLVPESHHAHPKFLTTIMTILGAAVLFVAIRFAGV